MSRNARIFVMFVLAAVATLSVGLIGNVYGISVADYTGYQVVGMVGLFAGFIGLGIIQAV